jgi:hypothetical protein
MSVLYGELYVGLLFHIFNQYNNNIVVQEQIAAHTNTFFVMLFDESLYDTITLSHTCDESYDMFCSRIKNKQMLLNTIKAFFLVLQMDSIAFKLDFSFDDYVTFLFDLYKNKFEQGFESVENILDKLILCFKLDEKITIPKVHHQSIVCKKLISQKCFDFNINVISKIDPRSLTFKIKFKYLDLEEHISKYFKDA